MIALTVVLLRHLARHQTLAVSCRVVRPDRYVNQRLFQHAPADDALPVRLGQRNAGRSLLSEQLAADERVAGSVPSCLVPLRCSLAALVLPLSSIRSATNRPPPPPTVIAGALARSSPSPANFCVRNSCARNSCARNFCVKAGRCELAEVAKTRQYPGPASHQPTPTRYACPPTQADREFPVQTR